MWIERTLLAVAILSPAFAQAQSAPAFDVASVRPRTAADHGPAMSSCSNGHFVSLGPIRALLLWAYDLKPYQLVGVPDWDPTVMYDNSGLYAIDAKAAGSVSEAECKLMAQSLMGERFKMVAHKEQREMPVHALVVAKKGLRAKLASDSDSTGNKIVVNGRPMGAAPGAPADFKPPGWSMERLADFLAIADPRPTIDRTGLDGLYRINLDFSISNLNPNYEPPPGAGPDVKTALEEQMGLTLESTKAPVQMLIIDHMEKPDAN
jgi:uncharacterized protein (TIGR03435 family)